MQRSLGSRGSPALSLWLKGRREASVSQQDSATPKLGPHGGARLALEQQGNATTATEIAESFGSIVTANGLARVQAVREGSDMADPPLTKRARAAVPAIVGR